MIQKSSFDREKAEEKKREKGCCEVQGVFCGVGGREKKDQEAGIFGFLQ